MKTYSSTEAQNQFGKVLDEAQREPVVLQKNGRDHAVVVSIETFQEIMAKPARMQRIKELHEQSMKDHGEVYRALAK